MFFELLKCGGFFNSSEDFDYKYSSTSEIRVFSSKGEDTQM